MSQIDPDIQVLTPQYAGSWVDGAIIQSLTHGIYTAFLAVVLWQILSSTNTHRRQVKVLAGISVFMYIIATIHVALIWFYIRKQFIPKVETEETRYLALRDWMTTANLTWALTMSDIVAGINIFTTDSVTIWRC
ncbi:uncharacterized protein EV420DRAFT_1170494 [Desarmillaria tabescens]|uniref:Uncharacterized protein n=1 Tax=Armillaria tabescens TaxID=1929756 RepID=A0AA39JBC3_ARMTA|nr:uncharacterized protein EV420DRAFT_1170494 [Desarmillaria tabescens]KAK0439493.1 hypothetical protein EV420DRAFT_1170494 [Desarmillaria tabescens]